MKVNMNYLSRKEHWRNYRLETEEEYRLLQYIKWKGGWKALYYALTTEERIELFHRLKKEIEEWERMESK